MLAYASMTQSGLIFAEIGFGWRIIPLVHVISHAILRSLQILRSPSALHDRHELEAALGGPPGADRWALESLLPAWLQERLYRIALDRGFEEMVVGRLFVMPFLWLLECAADLERRWLAFLGGDAGPGGGRP
jgi:NAD(P)H-quinone oxidoreductase subunit 5